MLMTLAIILVSGKSSDIQIKLNTAVFFLIFKFYLYLEFMHRTVQCLHIPWALE